MNASDCFVSLLGPIVVAANGVRVANFRSQKTLALLAYLVREARPVSRDFLAALLWPDAEPAEARGHVRRALHDLGQKLPGVIHSDYYTAEIDPHGGCETDTARFSDLRAELTLASLEQAAALCRGQFLEGINLTGCPEFENWLFVERELWRGRAVDVLEQLLERHTRAGSYDQATECAWRLLRLEPWREDIYRELMVLLARTGHASLALRQFKLCRARLLEELGVEPSAETVQVYERIRLLAAHAPAVLPVPATPFIGRAGELTTLAAYLADPSVRVITVTGLCGIGKSRLALEAARRASEHSRQMFLDGVWIVRLAHGLDQGCLMGAVGRALGLVKGSAVEPELVLRFIKDREMLVVLDDVDEPDALQPELAAMVESAPQVKFLVTSPCSTQLPGERVMPLGGLCHLAGPAQALSEAMALLNGCCGGQGASAMTGSDRREAERLCRLLDGWPLGLEMAASWARLRPWTEIAGEIETGEDLFPARGLSPASRHTSVAAALGHSWSRLKPEEQEAVSRLALFEGVFTVHAATQAGISPNTLATLVAEGVVIVRAPSGNQLGGSRPVRCRLFPPFRRYVLGRQTA